MIVYNQRGFVTLPPAVTIEIDCEPGARPVVVALHHGVRVPLWAASRKDHAAQMTEELRVCLAEGFDWFDRQAFTQRGVMPDVVYAGMNPTAPHATQRKEF